MYDLLTDLVRRTRRPESTVQPRLPLAYEALPRTSHGLVVDEETATRVPAASPPLLVTREQTQPPPTPRAREPYDSPAIVATEMQLPPPGSTDAAYHSSRHAPDAASRLPNVLGRTAQLVSTAAPARVPVAVVAPAQATPTRLPAASVAPRELRAHVVAPIQPVTRAEVPQIRRARAEPLREGPAEAHEQLAPEIRISIGRIEVRATAAERPPARRQPSTAPPLTLDEYLAARTRRGTR
ncbi:hypothetical protein LuPra_01616 [Luteitalea pratensis]|uniref:Uncharacterized protein n=1 Tax=Luteitalea pratensis TaxID=1855912 RepID=A0A143PJ27_LUTPR|nr:hypothetical protein [Luteitalea pratensis]AMY08416.1 hypothetical protein LuPra_01616 [Luteitalea pratensis]